MHYALLLTNAEPEPGQVSDHTIAQMQQAMADYTAALHAAGVLVGADILAPVSDTVTVTRRDGDLRIQNGPFADTREALAGVFVLDVPDHDTALTWAQKCPATQYAVIEVRRAAATVQNGAWSTGRPATQ